MVLGPRKGKMKASKPATVVAQLTEYSPGVLVNKNYKPGGDKAFDNVVKNDPTKIKASGLGDRFKI